MIDFEQDRWVGAMAEPRLSTLDSTLPDQGKAIWSIPEHAGEFYQVVMARLHDILKPRNYFEIGVQNGATLRIAKCISAAVDPEFQIDGSALSGKSRCFFYQMTSDEFFRDYDLTAIFGGPVDIAFLDGMHWYEYLLRDFINTEKHCKRNSVIMIHDCLPTDEHVGRRLANDDTLRARSDNASWWAGDVWKAIAILLKYRKDLRVLALNAPPTGLILVTNLNPYCETLAARYFDVVAEFRDLSLSEYGDEYRKLLSLVDTKTLSTADVVSLSFWL
jgi:hypothetical protein